MSRYGEAMMRLKEARKWLMSVDHGWCVIRTGLDLSRFPHEHTEAARTIIVGVFGMPIHVFDRWGLWKELGVSLDVAPHRASGTGYNPLHLDVVNAAIPPDVVCFYCERNDPFGGGSSIVSNLHRAWRTLDDDTISALSEPVYREGKFYELRSVGGDANPFPVVDQDAGRRCFGSDRPFFRFTAKMISDLPEGRSRTAMIQFHRALDDIRWVVELQAGDLLMLNQWAVAHGRLALRGGQQSIHPHERRLIAQCFLRFRSVSA